MLLDEGRNRNLLILMLVTSKLFVTPTQGVGLHGFMGRYLCNHEWPLDLVLFDVSLDEPARSCTPLLTSSSAVGMGLNQGLMRICVTGAITKSPVITMRRPTLGFALFPHSHIYMDRGPHAHPPR